MAVILCGKILVRRGAGVAKKSAPGIPGAGIEKSRVLLRA